MIGTPTADRISIMTFMSIFTFACSTSADISSIPKDALIVDVRTVEEFNTDRYQGAINIPLDSIKNRLSEFGAKDQTVIVYCRSGRRSGIAKKLLKEAGYTKVYNGGSLSRMRSLK